jgi:large subunit ribosomal protein L23
MTVYDILRRPVITEKSNFQSSTLGQYVFEVQKSATKAQIKEAVEALFAVEVARVNVLNSPSTKGRRGRGRRLLVRTPSYKKAIVTLAPGQKIDILEGVK